MVRLSNLVHHTQQREDFPGIRRVKMSDSNGNSATMDIPEDLYTKTFNEIEIEECDHVHHCMTDCTYAANAHVLAVGKNTLHITSGGLLTKVETKQPIKAWTIGQTLLLQLR